MQHFEHKKNELKDWTMQYKKSKIMLVNKSDPSGIHIAFWKAVSPINAVMFWMNPEHMLSIYTLTRSLPLTWIDLIMSRTLLHFFKVILHKTLEVGAKTYWPSQNSYYAWVLLKVVVATPGTYLLWLLIGYQGYPIHYSLMPRVQVSPYITTSFVAYYFLKFFLLFE